MANLNFPILFTCMSLDCSRRPWENMKLQTERPQLCLLALRCQNNGNFCDYCDCYDYCYDKKNWPQQSLYVIRCALRSRFTGVSTRLSLQIKLLLGATGARDKVALAWFANTWPRATTTHVLHICQCLSGNNCSWLLCTLAATAIVRAANFWQNFTYGWPSQGNPTQCIHTMYIIHFNIFAGATLWRGG